MREVRIKVPEHAASALIHTIQKLGVDRIGVSREYVHGPDRWEEVICVETSTPDGAQIVETIQNAPSFFAETGTITVRELRAIDSAKPIQRATVPIEVPHIDVVQDLWQFCHVTYGHVGRVTVAALLLAYAMIRGSSLLLLGGLLFLPGLPNLLAIGQGTSKRDHRLALQGVLALVTTIALLVACGALVGALVPGPLRFDDFLPPEAAAVVSAGIGVAGALATLDDVGKRELIGLASAAQVGLVPTWLGIGLVQGFDAAPAPRVLSYLGNLGLIAIAAAVVYGVVRRRRARQRTRPVEPDSLPQRQVA